MELILILLSIKKFDVLLANSKLYNQKLNEKLRSRSFFAVQKRLYFIIVFQSSVYIAIAPHWEIECTYRYD